MDSGPNLGEAVKCQVDVFNVTLHSNLMPLLPT